MPDSPVSQSPEVRSRFLSYFERNGHTVVPSSSLVPYNDPSLLFTNAGMVQFKDVFTGRERRPYVRATSSQRCIRAGGKHNDLENVGRTARHHTFFEMLGNFSFGDYFKREAITYAWELLTRELGIPQDRLIVTVFGGDDALGLGADDESREIWRSVSGLPDDRIQSLGAKDNFWQMGDTGPCGPCSEIHYHQGDELPCPEERCQGPACDCDRWVEIWNLVFMQFERHSSGQLTPLPAPSVDTGMGLERLCSVLQGVRSTYETDLFTPIIAEVERLSGKRFDPDDYEGDSVSIRAIADHARATAFLIADGVMPEKTGREYVLRRIMRRAIYHGWLLGIRSIFLHQVTQAVIEKMAPVFPELRTRQSTIVEVAQMEETRFRETLDRGMSLLEDAFDRASDTHVLPGDVAFRLYDTFGFPLDLTQVIAEQRGFTVDLPAYEAAMAEQRRRSRFVGSGEEAVDDVFLAVRDQVGATEFLGYDATEGDGKVLAIIADGERVASRAGGSVMFVTERTPFYGEQGGQVGDTGEATGESGLRITITDTRKPGGDMIVHVGEIVGGVLHEGDQVHLLVDSARRDAIRKNHSATHLLHWALRRVLGEHVAQKGSVVAPDRLRFDFSHGRAMSPEEIREVETSVNERIWRNEQVNTAVMDAKGARETGALAFFGEKYGDQVRVVQMAESKEFCGGVHVHATGDIGLFKITDEAGISQGTRRIVAVTGPGALEYVQQIEDTVEQVAERVRASATDVVEKVDRLRDENRALQRQVEELQRKLATTGSRDLMSDLRDLGGIKVLATRTEASDPKALRSLGDDLRDRLKSGVLALAGIADGKVSLVTMVTKDLTDRFSASQILEQIAPLVGGRGGGRPELAQGSGSRPEGVDAALAKVYELVKAAAGSQPPNGAHGAR